MPKLKIEDLIKKVNSSLSAKKKDHIAITTGADLPMPNDYIKCPEPILKVLGLPGYPTGRVVQIAGKPNSGKTTLATLALVESQKTEEFYTILVDTESKFAKNRFEKMGGDYENLIVIGAKTIEQGFVALNSTMEVIYSKDPDAKILIVWDSLGGTPSEAEADVDADQSIQLATCAKVIKRELRKFVPRWIHSKDICFMVINTSYANIGSVGRTNSGGEGIAYSSCIILELSRVGDLTKQVKGDKVKYGITTRMKCTKNHLMESEFTMSELRFDVLAYSVEFQKKKKKESVDYSKLEEKEK